MRFFEKGFGPLALESRVYANVFDRSATRYVYWELRLDYPPAPEDINFRIEAIYYRPNGTVARQGLDAGVERGWTNSWYWKGRGWREPGNWGTGVYRVDVHVDGEVVASGEFAVVSRNVPSSGPLADLRDDLNWAQEPLSSENLLGVLALGRVMEADPALASALATLPWVRDGLSERSLRALQQFAVLARKDIELARRVASQRWFADGVSEDEWLALRALALIAARDPVSAELLRGLEWLQDDLDRVAVGIILNIQALVDADTTLARTLLSYPWIGDRPTSTVRSLIWQLLRLTHRDRSMATELAEMNLVAESGGELQAGVVGALVGLYDTRPDFLSEIVAQPWFADGLTPGEAAIVSVLRTLSRLKPELAEDLLLDGRAQSRAMESALSGTIRLHIVHRADVVVWERIAETVTDMIHKVEQFYGARLPAEDVILLLEPEREVSSHSGTYLTIKNITSAPIMKRVLAHELSHYYFRSSHGPIWFSEGVANFVEYYMGPARTGYGMEDRMADVRSLKRSRCHFHGVDNIRELNEATAGLSYSEARELPFWLCHYSIGEFFVLNAYNALGRDAVSSALKELYLLTRSEHRPVTEEEIYRAFLSSTPPEKVADFNELYRKIHGGEIPEP